MFLRKEKYLILLFFWEKKANKFLFFFLDPGQTMGDFERRATEAEKLLASLSARVAVLEAGL